MEADPSHTWVGLAELTVAYASEEDDHLESHRCGGYDECDEAERGMAVFAVSVDDVSSGAEKAGNIILDAFVGDLTGLADDKVVVLVDAIYKADNMNEIELLLLASVIELVVMLPLISVCALLPLFTECVVIVVKEGYAEPVES